MKIISILFSVLITLSCQKNDTKKTLKVSKTQLSQSKNGVIGVKKAPESKLKGLFIFGMTHQDKQKIKPNSRAYIIRQKGVEVVNQYFKCTFYGNGKGVFFHDNGTQRYLTKKMIAKSSFEYKIKGDDVLVKDSTMKAFKPFLKILDEGLKLDYFEVSIEGFDKMNYGMYKVGNINK